MQLRHLLYVVAFSIAAAPVRAQHVSVTRNDTAAMHAVANAHKHGPPLLASELPDRNSKKQYNPIPLAGQKSYFGDKNDYVNDFVRRYLELHYNSLSAVQNRSANPFAVIDDELERKNLPKELKYIAVIESALDNNAVSSAGAVGPWQLMETTARMMGLTVSRKHDERRDLVKSTTAATRYLQDLYGELNDWLLVIAAYNSGPTPVEHAIERTGSRNFWDIKQYLPRETQGYVLAYIATASIFEKLNKFISLGSIPVDFKFGMDDEVAATSAVAKDAKGQPVTTAVKKLPFTDAEMKNMCMVRINEPLYLDLIAQELAVDKNLLTRWNSDYDMFIYNAYPTKYYNLRIPKDKLDLFLKKQDMLTKKSKQIFAANK